MKCDKCIFKTIIYKRVWNDKFGKLTYEDFEEFGCLLSGPKLNSENCCDDCKNFKAIDEFIPEKLNAIGYQMLIDKIRRRTIDIPDCMTADELRSWLNGFEAGMNMATGVIEECMR